METYTGDLIAYGGNGFLAIWIFGWVLIIFILSMIFVSYDIIFFDKSDIEYKTYLDIEYKTHLTEKIKNNTVFFTLSQYIIFVFLGLVILSILIFNIPIKCNIEEIREIQRVDCEYQITTESGVKTSSIYAIITNKNDTIVQDVYINELLNKRDISITKKVIYKP